MKFSIKYLVISVVASVILTLILNTDIKFRKNTEEFKGVDSSYNDGTFKIKIGF